ALEKGGQPLTPRGQLMDPSLANVPRMQTDANGTLTPTGKSGTTMPVPDEGRVVHPGGGQQGLYMPTPDESLASKLKTEAANKPPKEPRTRVDTESFSQPVLIDEESGDVKPLKIPEGITHTGKPSAGHGYQFSYHTDDEGNVHVLRGDPDSGEVTEVKTVKGAGGKKKDPDAPAKPSAAQLRLITEKKATGLKQAEQSYGKLMTDMGGAMSPEDKQAAVASLTKAKQAAQDEYEQSLSALGLPVQHFDFGSQAEPQATDAGGGNRVGRGGLITSAPAKKASAKGKLTDTNVAQQYLQKAGGDKAKARQLAKADGWEF
ncbi:MAG TPA: hypothetical protein VN776_15415, partial [Terracidiphilus sp.]|nr:hypothetical protein [Terracidiphilus sp.]